MTLLINWVFLCTISQNISSYQNVYRFSLTSVPIFSIFFSTHFFEYCWLIVYFHEKKLKTRKSSKSSETFLKSGLFINAWEWIIKSQRLVGSKSEIRNKLIQYVSSRNIILDIWYSIHDLMVKNGHSVKIAGIHSH